MLRSTIEVTALFTHKDDPGEEIWFRTPRALAEERGIPVYEPESLRAPEWIEKIRRLSPDFLFSFYYRNMLPKEILDIPRIAPLNLHGSLLPKFRGRCPVNWVLVKGESRTGVTLHIMEVKPDAGDIVARKEVDIDFSDTAHSLFMKLASAGRELMRETLPLLASGTFDKTPQVGLSSYFGGRKPEDGVIDWQREATELYNLVRAVTHPYPGAFTFFNGKKLYIWKAHPEKGHTDAPAGTVVSKDPLLIAAGEGLLRLISLQLVGESEMDAADFVALHTLDKERLGGMF